MSIEIESLKQLYRDFNARNMEAVLASLDANATWANGMEGGHVHGRGEVRGYWTRQWAIISPKVEPLDITDYGKGKMTVEVRQVVHDLEGKLVLDQMVGHIFQFKDGLVQRFDIRD